VRLTATTIPTLQLPQGKTDHIVWDDDIPGFGVRLRAGGSKVFIFVYKIGTKSRSVTLGRVSAVDVGRARSTARDFYFRKRLGGDPALDKKIGLALETYVARKALTFLEREIEPACYLYRHYHPSGDLLYVGISLEPLRRQDRHTKAAGWRNMICRIVIEPFATREEALAAEARAIRDEFPKFNVVHNKSRHPIQELRS